MSTKKISIFRGISSLETRCPTLKKHTRVLIFFFLTLSLLLNWLLSCFIFKRKHFSVLGILKAYKSTIYRTFINFSYTFFKIGEIRPVTL